MNAQISTQLPKVHCQLALAAGNIVTGAVPTIDLSGGPFPRGYGPGKGSVQCSSTSCNAASLLLPVMLTNSDCRTGNGGETGTAQPRQEAEAAYAKEERRSTACTAQRGGRAICARQRGGRRAGEQRAQGQACLLRALIQPRASQQG